MIEQAADSRPKRVLIVNKSEDTREVLRTALQRRGVSTLEATQPQQGLQVAKQHHPQVIVLDTEDEEIGDQSFWDEYYSESREQKSSIIVLGRARKQLASLPQDCVVAKPYHYAPLIRTIEELVGR